MPRIRFLRKKKNNTLSLSWKIHERRRERGWEWEISPSCCFLDPFLLAPPAGTERGNDLSPWKTDGPTGVR
jgi:hypothetical protein